jgi:nitrite reductase/ring-hydroxylating ferredoxin subunit
MHFSRFDVTTGKLLSGPRLEMGGAAKMFARCPEDVQKEMTQMFRRLGENQSLIKTYDQPVYSVKSDGNDVLVQL